MTQRRILGFTCIILGLTPCALSPHRALAQASNDPLILTPKLLDVLDGDGFAVQRGAATHKASR